MNEKIRLLRERLRNLKLEGMIVTNPVSIKYLTNIENEGTLLITRKENIFLTYTMFLESVKKTVTINDEIIVADFRDISQYENFFLFCENVGFEENYVTYKQYYYLKQKYKVNNLSETEDIIEIGPITINKDAQQVKLDGDLVNLTRKEFGLLYILAKHHNHVYSREKLLNLVWGSDHQSSERTVDTHIKTLRIKMKKHGSFIKTVWGIGYKLEVDV